MDSNTNRVKEFFDDTYLYLHKPYGIRMRSAIVRELIGGVRDASILDIGCGDGSISLQFVAANHVTLLDISDQMLTLAQNNVPEGFQSNVNLVNIDFLTYQPAQPFDVVICLGVLAYVSPLDLAINKLSSFVKNGGICILEFTDHNRPIARIKYSYFKAYRHFFKSFSYSITLVTQPMLDHLVSESNLVKIKECRHSLILPGMRKLFSDQFLYQLEMATSRNQFLSRQGTEVIWLVKKTETISSEARY